MKIRNLRILFFLSFFLVISCESPKKKKEDVAQKIAQESCQQMSELSSQLVGGIVSGLASFITDGDVDNVNTGSLGSLPAHWCDCYSYFVTKDLSEKFSEEELIEISNDDTKKIMVLEKILELRKDDMLECIEQSTQEKFNNYDSFSKKLDEKFK